MKAAEMTHYKNQLLKIRARLVEEIRRLGESLAEDVKTPGDLSNVPTHNADHDSEGVDTTIALENMDSETVNQVDAALARIDDGTFGRCVDCKADIAPERLEAIPYTPYCLRCEAKREGEANGRNTPLAKPH